MLTNFQRAGTRKMGPVSLKWCTVIGQRGNEPKLEHEKFHLNTGKNIPYFKGARDTGIYCSRVSFSENFQNSPRCIPVQSDRG